MFSGLKEFLFKGNVLDLAVGVIIAGAFGKIIDSLVANIIMPIVGLVLGGTNVKDLAFTLKEAKLNAAGAVVEEAVKLSYGNFFQTVIDFIIIGTVLYMIVNAAAKAAAAKKAQEAAIPAPAAVTPAQEVLLTQIRDLLRSGR
jgi:large conductance mechanosensitive channel